MPPDDPAFSAAAEDDGIGRYVWAARAVGFVLLVVLGGWASVTDISGAVIASGQVAVESNARSVQHVDGGIVADILVKDGDIVAAGDVLIRLDASDLEDERAGLETQQAATASEHDFVEAELEGLRSLKQQGLVTNERYMALERQAARLKGQVGTLRANNARNAAKLRRAEIRAPIGGYVHALAVHTLGGVVGAGEEILQIVPSTDRMIVEVRLDPRDIDQVRRGQDATLRLSGFDRQNTPQLNGEVTQISADLVTDTMRGTAYYTMRIALSGDIDEQLEGRPIVPGMPVEAFVKTDRRTVLSYLVKPLSDNLNRAFREQ